MLAASALGLGGSGLLLGAGTSTASSHKEAPLLISDPQVDNTDLYAFVSPDSPDTVTFIANTQPFQDPAGGPNFFPFADQARYNIEIDTDGDAVSDVTYRWTFETEDNRGEANFEGSLNQAGSILYNNGPVESFGDATLLFKQTYTLEKIDGEGTSETLMEDVPVAPSRVGDASMPDYQALRDEATVDLEGGGKTFAGQAYDPFFLDLRVFNLLYGADLSEVGNDTLAGKNVNSIAIQVPIKELVTGDDPVIGVHTNTERPSMRVQGAGTQEFSGDFVQVSRLGNPLANEAVIPSDLKDAFNSLDPADDASVEPAVNAVNDPEIPYLLEALYGLERPEAPRDDLFAIFLTGLKGLNQPAGEVQPAELLRLNTSIEPTAEPNRLGVLAGDNQGFPNGRRLADDIVDIELQALAGAVSVDEEGAPTGVDLVEALAEGDKVDSNPKGFEDSFPYVALPDSGSEINANDEGSSDGETPGGGVDAGFGGLSESGGLPVVPVGLGLLGVAVMGGGLVLLRNRS